MKFGVKKNKTDIQFSKTNFLDKHHFFKETRNMNNITATIYN